ncbi:unnamed protein product, partial [Porites lobata]
MTLSNKRIEDKSSESTLSIYPIATGTVKREGQSNLKQLLRNLKLPKGRYKKSRIWVGGKKYNISLAGNFPLKLEKLLPLLNKKEQEDFILGGKGYGMEFCAFCDAIRACTCHGVEADETCLECLRSKANIGRNCEQILGSLGLFAYRVERLDQLDEALSDFGPEIDGGF